MTYKEFQGKKLSALGMGAMRLPQKDGVPDKAAVAEMVDYALSHGVNYFDTAYGYHGGKSEGVLCEALSRHKRSSYYLADKFPGYSLDNMDKVEPIFEEQLRRCQTDYFDFYLFHNVYEKNIDPYLDPKYGIMDYLWKQKEQGRIRHLGFSCHGKLDVLKRFLDTYGSRMEFCQLQVNYLDWNFQDAKAKLELCKAYGIPVWIMEPLRGGRLCALPQTATEKLKALRPDETVPGWAFRFIQSLENVGVTLSGMSSSEQLKQNIKTFETNEPLNSEEFDLLVKIADDMVKAGVLQCTACRYCTEYCPQGLDIPALLSLYNEHIFTGGGFIAPMAVDALPEDKRPSACLACRACEAVCPQKLKISEAFADFVEKLK